MRKQKGRVPRPLDFQVPVSPSGKFTWLQKGRSLQTRLWGFPFPSPLSLPYPVPNKSLVLDRQAEPVSPLFSVTWVHVTEQGLNDFLSGQVGQQRPPEIQPCQFKNKARDEEDPFSQCSKREARNTNQLSKDAWQAAR